VPSVLLSGDHRLIEEYRFLESVRKTLERRPELLIDVTFSKAEKKLLQKKRLWQAVQEAVAVQEQYGS